MADFKLIHGFYESVITHVLEERLSRISDRFYVKKKQLDSEESSFVPMWNIDWYFGYILPVKRLMAMEVFLPEQTKRFC